MNFYCLISRKGESSGHLAFIIIKIILNNNESLHVKRSGLRILKASVFIVLLQMCKNVTDFFPDQIVFLRVEITIIPRIN